MKGRRPPRPKFQAEIELTDSTVIARVRYDAEKKILDVKLRNGNAYRYRSIFSHTFADLVTQQSSGKVFNERVKGRYATHWDPQARQWVSEPRKVVKIRW